MLPRWCAALAAAVMAAGVLGGSTAAGKVNSFPPGTVFRDCDVCPELVVVPAGSFVMGSERGKPTERPVHRVTIARPFAIGRAEVTVGQWKACVADGVCRDFPYAPMHWPDDHPQDGPGWKHSKVYLQWLSRRTGKRYRLPSEAEWEYAARGGTTTRFWWGERFERDHANCKNCGPHIGIAGLKPAGAYPANPFGLYDVAGSLYEWAEDCWNESYDGAPVDGSAWLEGECKLRIARSGSRFSGYSPLRPAYRYKFPADSSSNLRGLRVVRELP